jgi:hypothetical protein
VVAPNQLQTIVCVKSAKQRIDFIVGSIYSAETPILPQLFSISQFHVGEALLKIVVEGIEKQATVRGKFVCGASVSSMAVAYQHDFGSVVEIQIGGRLGHAVHCFSQPGACLGPAVCRCPERNRTGSMVFNRGGMKTASGIDHLLG